MTKVKKTKSKKSEKDSGEAPARSVSKKRATRSGSNVFAMFTQHQVAQFKEAFQFIDSDKDGIISKNDIRATFDALGRLCTDKELEEMASEAPVSILVAFFLLSEALSFSSYRANSSSNSSPSLREYSTSGTNQFHHISDYIW